MTVVDGMAPILAMGGSGDVLAGLAAALIARCPARLHDAAACAAALLIAAGRAAAAHSGFCDPLDVAAEAGKIAGAAWLPPSAAVPKEE
jgi:NAD(P)H-hydrate repair Nnr-like enzyme with NAD(P)H-hydrate dehydratase domain